MEKQNLGDWQLGFSAFKIRVSPETHQRLRSSFPSLASRISELRFQCNVCGQHTSTPWKNLGRETESCGHCGSTVRMRGMMHALSIGLFGKSIPLSEFPVNKDIKGKGMSDWPGYAVPLAAKFDYVNTYYHQEPFLDITKIPESDWGSLDFLVSTDVYEHVTPPVGIAFENTYKLLKPGGVFAFSVPYGLEGRTIEHFPELHDFKIEVEDGRHVLYNKTKEGREQVFRDLIFHGGPGDTLEMRVFSLSDLWKYLRDAGFSKIQVLDQDDLSYGIHWPHRWSLPMVAIK